MAHTSTAPGSSNTKTNSKVRTRFAPSPTGYLHIGGVRTALFSYLYAKKDGGQFVLRIEDTDTERSESKYTDDIIASLKWLGLDWDVGPIFQSERFTRYAQAAQTLVSSGSAYYCDCTAEQVEQGRKNLEAQGKKPMYDGRCRDRGLSPTGGAALVVRFKTPRTGSISYNDGVRGVITFPLEEIDDFVCLRTNGSPTYNHACVVDDVDNDITHVIRGDDHINNMPKQLLIYDALKMPVPVFAHLPMILGTDKKKLSKRHGAVSANAYRAEGYLPHAVINYLARLGWSHGDQEIFSKQELISFFDLDHIGSSGAVFNTEKLQWLNAHYLKLTPALELVQILVTDFMAELKTSGQQDAEIKSWLESPIGQMVVDLYKPKVKLLKELALAIAPVLSTTHSPAFEMTPEFSQKWTKAKLEEPLSFVVSELTQLANNAVATLHESGVTHDQINVVLKAAVEKYGLKLVDLMQPLRVLVFGVTSGPGLFDLLCLVPWPTLKARLSRYKDILS